MTEPRLFRVLEIDCEQIKLNPISQKDDQYIDHEDKPVNVDISDIDESLEQTISFVEQGHVVKAELTEINGIHRFNSIEHRGGFTLVELDPRTVPYILTEYWDREDSPSKNSFTDDNLVIPLSQIVDDSVGELFIQPCSSLNDGSWNRFTNGNRSESVYGGFHTVSGKPVEVFIGNPNGERYWYALLFSKEGSTVARQIRAQYGYLYDDHYIPNPAWDFSKLIDSEKLPENPDNDPKAVFRPEYNVPSTLIPSRFGSDTIELSAEFVYVGSHLGINMLGGSSDSLDPSQPLNYEPEDLVEQDISLIVIYKFYTSLLMSIYEIVQSNPDKDIQALVEEGTLPEPELLYCAHTLFTSSIHGIESYLQKMEQVPIEEYVVSQLRGGLSPEVQEIKDEFNISGLPLTIRFLVHDWGLLLDDIQEVLEVAKSVADVEETKTGLKYKIGAEEQAYDFINQHQDRISNQTMPAEFGGEDRGVFTELLGRLEKRHDWLTTSSMGPLGNLLDSFREELS